VKSSQREEIASKLSKKITRMRDRRTGEKTGKEALDALLDIEVDEPKPTPLEEKKQVVLLLRNGLTGADRNWTKYPNEMHDVMAQRLGKEAESVLYVYLWRQSWGFGRNYCRISYSKILQNTVISARNTARRSLAGLVDKKFVIKVLNTDGEHDVSGDGALYRILTPLEISSGITEEKVFLSDIPEEGVPIQDMTDKGMPRKGIDIKHSNTRNPNDMSSQDMPIQSMPQADNAPSGHIDMSSQNMPREGMHKLEKDKSVVSINNAQRGHAQKEHPLKDNKDNIKDSLSSRDIISAFYKDIGQKRVTKTKREKAEKYIEELLNEEFSLEDIQFAVQWTLENSKEDIYDFAIIKHTISQAIVDKEKLEAEKARKLEKEKMAIQEQEAERRNEEELAKLKAHKEELSEVERTELYKKAMDEIAKMEGVKKEFVTPILIEAKENEILKAKLENDR